MDPVLTVAGLHTHFLTRRGRLRAVNGVDLTLHRGRTLGVVGESGSGKTILARSIMGLLPKTNVVTAGSVHLNGRELIGLRERDRRALCGREMAMVFQDPMSSLNPVMPVGRQITEALRLHLGMRRRAAREAGIELLRRVNIPEPERRLAAFPHELSGGMRQRVMIALAVACGPQVLFADEPTTALDVTVQAEILNLLGDLQADAAMATVLITHDLGVVAGRTNDIAVMYAGRIVEQAPTPQLFASPRHPYTEALLRSVPRLDQPSHTPLRAITGRPPDLLAPSQGCAFAARCPYVQSRCDREVPELAASAPGHLVACFAPVGSAEGQRALDVNVGRGVAAARALSATPLAVGGRGTP